MGKKRLDIHIDSNTYTQIHEMRSMIIESNDIIIYRMTEAQTNQQFYRELLRAGIKAKLFEFAQKEKEIKDENKDLD